MKTTYTAFKGHNLFAHGTLDEVVLTIKGHIGKSDHSSVFIFSDSTGKMIDFNFQGTQKDILKRLEIFISEENPKENTGPGRPKLGVMSREVSLLPQHWEWLATQPGGASAILRKLVDEAKKKSLGTPTIKQIQEKVHRFVSSIAGDFEGYEEALRALYRKDKKEFLQQIESWPTDIKKHVMDLAKPIFSNENE
jgi:hypothetical protein